MTNFASDNVTAACPEVIQAINNANNGNVDSYGDDQWTNNLERKFSELFEKKVKVFTAITGTAANSLALSAITPNYGNIYCHKISHINVDECGAPEFFTGGAKLTWWIIPIMLFVGFITPLPYNYWRLKAYGLNCH